MANLGGPAVSFSGSRVAVAGHPGATAALVAVAARLSTGCTPRTERSDPRLVSVIWRCGNSITAATISLAGHPLALADVMKGAYPAYLSSVAASQFQVEGISHPATSDLGTWYLTPAALAVVFPAGVVSYPLASLTAYLRSRSSL